MSLALTIFSVLAAAAITGTMAGTALADACTFEWDSGTQTCDDPEGGVFCQGIGVPAGANTHTTFANLRDEGFSASTIPLAGNTQFPEECRAGDDDPGASFGPPRTCASTLVPTHFRVLC